MDRGHVIKRDFPKPMRIDPATCALCGHVCALGARLPRRDGEYTTPTFKGFRRTDQRRLHLEAIGLIIQEVRFYAKPPPGALRVYGSAVHVGLSGRETDFSTA